MCYALGKKLDVRMGRYLDKNELLFILIVTLNLMQQRTLKIHYSQAI